MLRSLAICFVLAVCAPVISQTTVQMAFPNNRFLNAEGGHRSYYIGGYAEGRQQMVYGDYQGDTGSARTLKGMAFRRSKMTPITAGRKWTNFEIRVAEADFQGLSDRWSGNLRSNVTLVYKGAVAFPSAVGTPGTSPAPWGAFAAAGDMVFPFGTGGTNPSFLHRGVSGTTFDFQMQGGTLNNNAAWGTNFHPYYVDGCIADGGAGNVWTEATQGRTGVTTCVPTGSSRYATWQTWLFSDNTKVPIGGMQHRWQWYGYGMIPNHPHIGVYSFFPQTPGIQFLGSCQKLDLDLTKPFNTYPFMTDANGDSVEPFYNWVWTPGSIGLRMHTQAAFDDNGSLQLTAGYFATIAAPPPITADTTFSARIHDSWSPTSGRSYGFGPYDTRIAIIGVY